MVTVLEAVLRDTDLLIEGDEHRHRISVLMPGTPFDNVALVAERLRKAVAGQDPGLLQLLSISWLSLNEVQATAKVLAP